MADQKPGVGTIVRADFGGGVDQSMDAWRVPPSQLADLVNGRLERVGSVRKRTGYTTITAPPAATPNTGAPMAAVATPTQTLVLDRARDAAIDFADGGPIAPEAGYVARNYAPTSTNAWITRGAVSDVLSDVRAWDADAGDYDEAFDMGADGPWVFVLKITRAKKLYGAALGQLVTLTISQYDATTHALVSRLQLNLRGHVYPKLAVFPNFATLVISTASPNTRVGIDTNTVAATINLWTCTYSAAGLTGPIGAAVVGCANDCDWSDLAAFYATTAERYRPIVPYDLIANRDYLVLTVYSSRTGTLRANLYAVGPGAIGFGGTSNIAKPGGLPYVAIATYAHRTDEFCISGVALPLNMALAPPWAPADGVHAVWRVDLATLALITSASVAIPRTGAAAFTRLTPGAVHVIQTLETTIPANMQFASFAELLQWDPTTGDVFAHYVHRITMSGNPGAIVDDENLSSAVPTARPFLLTYYGAQFSAGRFPVRVPFALGVSQQAWYGRFPANSQPVTDVAANYSGNIGTAIVTGPYQRTTTIASSPAQTVAPRLLPTTGPSSFKIGTKVHVPHRPAVDAAGGFAFASLELTARAPGDALHGSFGGVAVSAGGLVQTLDGTASGESAIVDRPRVGAIVRSGGGVQIDWTDGDYLVTAIFTYRDAFGMVHRSAPADPYRLTVTGAQDTWTIYYSIATFLDRDDAAIEFYITEPNGTILRRWFTLPASPDTTGGSVAGWRSVVVRDAGSLGVSQALGLPTLDAPTLYTTGGALPFVPVGSARFALLYRNRLLVGGADDGKSVYYSNEPEAFEAPSFAAGNVIRLEHESGCTAAGTLNDKLILFSPTGTYAVYGQFRDRFGAGDALSDPESVHDYVGCDQPASVVSIPTGLLFFATDFRFYLIDERLQLVPVGLRVQELTTAEQGAAGFTICEGAVHIIEEREVRFYMRQDSADPKRRIVVYNYQVDQWSQDIVHQYRNPGSWGGVCSSRDLGVLVASSSAWAKDDRTTYFDATSQWITLTARTAWIQPGGSQDYARVRYCQFLGRSAAPHDLAITVYTDFDTSSVKGTGTWTAAQLAPIAATSWPAQVKLQVGSQKTQATQIVIEDAAPIGATTGQGPQLVGLALEVLPLGGVKRLPNTRKR